MTAPQGKPAGLTHTAAGTVVLLDPEQAPYELTASSLDELRGRSV